MCFVRDRPREALCYLLRTLRLEGWTSRAWTGSCRWTALRMSPATFTAWAVLPAMSQVSSGHKHMHSASQVGIQLHQLH